MWIYFYMNVCMCVFLPFANDHGEKKIDVENLFLISIRPSKIVYSSLINILQLKFNILLDEIALNTL